MWPVTDHFTCESSGVVCLTNELNAHMTQLVNILCSGEAVENIKSKISKCTQQTGESAS